MDNKKAKLEEIKKKLKEKDLAHSKSREIKVDDLNPGQLEIYTAMRKFVDGGDDAGMFLLKGYAGTGKTYLVKKLVKHYLSTHKIGKIAVTAPTNKAVKVLRRSGDLVDKRVEFLTVHKLLGLKEQISASGEITFASDNYEQSTISGFKVLIVDEVSMLSDELFLEIEPYRDTVKIIMMGDPAQIPPVGRVDCIPFHEYKHEKYGIKSYTLTEIMRQKEGNSIIESSFSIRENLESHRPIQTIQTKLNTEGHGIVYINANVQEERDGVMTLFKEYFGSKNFKDDSDYAKIIAWRNVTINGLNVIIRKILFGEGAGKICVGEKLIANTPIMDPSMPLILFSTNDEFEVDEIRISDRLFATDTESVRLKIYDTRVKFYDNFADEVRYRDIRILHESSDYDYQKVVANLKKDAIQKKSKDAWRRYYEFIRSFADIGYNYSISAHKSQGSTYKNVFLIEDDIDKNRNIVERNRIKYTAYSRPSDKLFILRKD